MKTAPVSPAWSVRKSASTEAGKASPGEKMKLETSVSALMLGLWIKLIS
jgi:hypothetical protein